MPFNNAISLKANGTIRPSVFVTLDTAGDEQVVQSTTGDLPFGVSQEGMKRTPGLTGSDNTVAAEAGDLLRIYGLGDDCLLYCGGTVTAADFLKPTGGGLAITATVGTDKIGAQALQSGTSGQKIRVRVVQMSS